MPSYPCQCRGIADASTLKVCIYSQRPATIRQITENKILSYDSSSAQARWRSAVRHQACAGPGPPSVLKLEARLIVPAQASTLQTCCSSQIRSPT